MTPDLREPEANSSNGDPVSAALAALATTFAIAAEPAGNGNGAGAGVGRAARHRTWLDTFDWRLNRAGLVLEYEHARRGGRLLLTRDDMTQAEQAVPGWSPARPHLASELPAGPVRDQIVKLASPRALLPVAKAAGRISVTRLLNEDGKTVARLIIDRSSVTKPEGTAAGLPPRLTIAEVRGYPGQARKAARLLAEIPGVAPAPDAFTEALTAAGRHPADYSNDLDTPITATMPAAVAVATLLLRMLDILQDNVSGVLRDIDTEFLHDLRVSVRRTRSAIKLLGLVLPAGLARQYAAEFKWLGDLTTPTRDLDVYLLGFPAMADQLVAASAADLEPFRAFLVKRRAREFRKLTAGLRSARFKALVADWRQELAEVKDGGGPRKHRNLTARELATATTGR